jgi:hypothetical protein
VRQNTWNIYVRLELGDFSFSDPVKDLAQFDRAFDHVAGRSEPAEGFRPIPWCKMSASRSTELSPMHNGSRGTERF